MPIKDVAFKGYDGKVITMSPSEILKAAKNDASFPWPYPLVRAVLEPKPRPGGISVTMLEQPCVRCVILQKTAEYTLNLERYWKRWRGTQRHSIMEEYAGDDSLTEVRFFARVPGCGELHGQVDELIVRDGWGTIRDWKFPTDAPKWDRPWNDHTAQVQTYRWLVQNCYETDPDVDVIGMSPEDFHNLEFDRLVVCYIADDGPKPLEVRKSIRVPKKDGNGTKPSRVPDIWSDTQVMEFVVPRYKALQEAFEEHEKTGKLPPYPEGFEFFQMQGLHPYSDTAELCIRSFVEGN